MLVHEYTMERDNGEKYLLITFDHHRAEIYRTEIPLKHERCAALRIAKLKEAAIDEFLGTFNGQKYTKKEVLKAYSKVDEYFKSVYKELYPHGGYRNGGRPKGSKTDKTERLNVAVTREEKNLLIETLERYRQLKAYVEKYPKEAKKCAPGMLPYIAESALLSGKLGNSLTMISERLAEIKKGAQNDKK